jgi:hypothetical protein
MTKRTWFVLIGSVAFLMSTGWFFSQWVGVKTSSDGLLAQPVTIRI